MGVNTMIVTVKVAKVNELVEFDVESLPAESLAYAITYGLTQSINDTHAPVSRKNFSDDESFNAAVWEKAQKRIDQIRSGNVPGTRTPVTKEAKVKQLAAA
jgi:hypothetical protein